VLVDMGCNHNAYNPDASLHDAISMVHDR
jgi:hypothetical protein